MLPKGEKGKLTLIQKQEILSYKGKESTYSVAKKYGISHTMVYKIWKKRIINHNGLQSNLDTSILKKLIPTFVKNSLRVSLDPIEIERIKILAKEVL